VQTDGRCNASIAQQPNTWCQSCDSDTWLMLASSSKNVPELNTPNSAKKEKKGWMHGEWAEFECVMEHHLRKELKDS
jgi:hypothetical protein